MKRAGSGSRKAAFPIRAAVGSDPVIRYRMRQNERLKMRLDSADDVTRYHLKQAIRRNERAMRMDAEGDDTGWITVHPNGGKGVPVKIEDGEVTAGAGGALNGVELSEAESQPLSELKASSSGSSSSGSSTTSSSSSGTSLSGSGSGIASGAKISSTVTGPTAEMLNDKVNEAYSNSSSTKELQDSLVGIIGQLDIGGTVSIPDSSGKIKVFKKEHDDTYRFGSLTFTDREVIRYFTNTSDQTKAPILETVSRSDTPLTKGDETKIAEVAAAEKAYEENPPEETRGHVEYSDVERSNAKFHNESPDNYNRALQVIRDTGYDEVQAAAVVDAVNRFTNGYETGIREAQEQSDADADSLTGEERFCLERANTLEQYIEDAPKYEGAIYRGIALDDDAYDSLLKQIENGEELDQKGLSSWTSEKSVAEEFCDGNYSESGGTVNEVLFVNTGGTKQGVSVKHISRYDHENEVMVSSKSRQIATNAYEETTDDGRRRLIVECCEAQ